MADRARARGGSGRPAVDPGRRTSGRDEQHDEDELDEEDEGTYQLPRRSRTDRHGRQRPDVSENARRLLAENSNDATLAVVSVLNEMYDLREERREERLASQRALPRKGELVLTAEEAVEWEAFSALELKAADIAALRDKATKLEAESAERAAEGPIAEAAAAVKWKPSVLKRLIKEDELVLETRLVDQPKADGSEGTEKVELPFVKKKGDDKAVAMALTEYGTKHWKDMLPALRAVDEEEEHGETDREDASAQGRRTETRVVRYPAQGTAGRASSAKPRASQATLDRKYNPRSKPGAAKDQ